MVNPLMVPARYDFLCSFKAGLGRRDHTDGPSRRWRLHGAAAGDRGGRCRTCSNGCRTGPEATAMARRSGLK